MANYDFEHLNSKQFERLANALGAENIARGLQIFGSGTDGGREATYEGRMSYPSAADPWDGYLVVQCKQKESRGASPKEEGQWAISQLDTEMAKYQTAKRRRRIPEYFLFITNAELSAQLSVGGKDKFNERLSYWKGELGIKGADVWDRDKLTSLLDGSQKVAERFGMLHGGDLIHYAAQHILAHRAGVETTLSVFLQEELRTDQYVNLAQAGHTNDDRTPLARVFVDLQAVAQANPDKSFHVVSTIQEESDRPVHPSLVEYERVANEAEILRIQEMQDVRGEAEYAAAEMAEAAALSEEAWEDEDDAGEDETGEEISPEELQEIDELFARLPELTNWRDPSRFVVIGGPGQGKSTLAQQLAQRHRAALLNANYATSVEPETERIVGIIENAANEDGSGLPKHCRWPFRVVLEQFADKLASKEVKSVLEYIAFLVRKRTHREFDQRDAEQLLATTPWFVALDGLDEVPAVSNRTEVLEAVNRFLMEARDKDADLLVIATTRPQGYEGEFKTSRFTHLNLKAFSKEEALVYAKKFVDVKYANDTDRQEKIMQRLETAAQEESIARLMQTPLQVTIMAALVDLVGNPPRERYQLFHRYYEIVYQREQERGLKLSDVLAHYRSGIEVLHDRIGLLLQIEAESAGKSQGRITHARLEGMVHDYLVSEELEGEELAQTKAEFMDVALHRLVFIAPLEDGRYGFEVRSLQEFSAARALMRGSYSVIKNRLRRIGPMPYWRNTMLFAVGKAFSEQNEPQCDMIMQLCRELNDDAADPVLYRTLAGSRLAVDILEDGVAERRPKYRRLFFETALELLHLPHADSARRLANLYATEYEKHYVKAIHSTAGSCDLDVPLGMFIVLAILVKLNPEVDWMNQTLRQYWPKQVDRQQVILEKISKYLIWDEWIIDTVSHVARVSDKDWVRSHLITSQNPIRWIHDAAMLKQSRNRKTVLVGKNPTFGYYIDALRIKQEHLERIREANPTHTSWLPYTLGYNFLINPSAETLAETLENLVSIGVYNVDTGYFDLPWQLVALINDVKSKDEMLYHAERARRGELGTTQDWKYAEERLSSNGFTVEDICAFSDDQWPYTVDIVHKGIQLAGLFAMINESAEDNEAVETLLNAFYKIKSTRFKDNLAGNIFFIIYHNYSLNNAFELPLEIIKELVCATIWGAHGAHILPVIDLDIDWVTEVHVLNEIGNHLSTLVDYEQLGDNLAEKRQNVVFQLVHLLGNKNIREGILRFIASLVVLGADVEIPYIQPDILSLEGRVALAAVNLLSSSPSIDIDVLAHEIIYLWKHKNKGNELEDMPRVLGILLDRTMLLPHAIHVLNILYGSNLIGMGTKQLIINNLMSQIQFRVSGLNNPSLKIELSMEWFFEMSV